MSPRRARRGVHRRDARVDMLRGLALVSMFVAHCAPDDGPFRLAALTEFATAPLFALLIGISAMLADRGNAGLTVAFVRAGVRAAVLVALGLWIEPWGAQVDVVLVYLALPTLLAPLLARLPDTVLLGIATMSWAAAPALLSWGRTRSTEALVAGDDVGHRLWDVVVAGPHYRLTTLLVFTCLGIVLWRWTRAVPAWSAGLAGLVALAGAALLMAAKTSGRLAFEPYDGSHLEIVLEALLVGGFALAWFAVVPERFCLPALAAAGSMTLSVYVLQIAYLAWYVRELHPGERDDAWGNVGVLCVGALVLPMAWRSLVSREPWSRGPLEGATAAVTRGIR
ncbi:hypothetical protein [Dermacoccus nishinomiyaensis]|uniref:hypothetical protein n=1 Tax=Dermacoccus nishinomiyaensis TaxID=1274 RepID=UPI00248E0FB8|nr:hypothetical protein [Dermacoccus nishinomiyaensis]